MHESEFHIIPEKEKTEKPAKSEGKADVKQNGDSNNKADKEVKDKEKKEKRQASEESRKSQYSSQENLYEF